jgi:hypothetical protein
MGAREWWMQRWAILRERNRDSTELDDRGLVPLKVAREVLAAHTIYQSGLPRVFGEPLREGSYRTEHLIWPALLSLHDAEEFLARAEPIQWMEGPHAALGSTLVDRYGDVVVPWLLAHVVDGGLINVPRSILTNLLAVGSRDVFDVLWKVRDLVDSTTPDRKHVNRGYRAPGDGWCFRASDGPTWADPERPVHRLVDQNIIIPWVRANLGVGVHALLERHAAGSERATEILRTILTSRYDHTRIPEANAVVEAALGAKAAKALAKKPRVKLTAEAILAQLDGCYTGDTPTSFLSWPTFRMGLSREVDEYHALRMIAVRGKGAEWGILFQRLAGIPLHAHDPVEVQVYSYGSACDLGQDHGPPYRFALVEDPGSDGIEGVVVDGRRGRLVLDDAMVGVLDLRPGESVEPHGGHHRANLMLRAYNSHFSDAVWGGEDPKWPAKQLRVDGGKVLLVADAFAHVGLAPDEPGAVRPSESPTFRSLAEALATKDPSRFFPGESNLDWRLHTTPTPDAGTPADE